MPDTSIIPADGPLQGLTKRQLECMQVLQELTDQGGPAPSYDDLARELDIAHRSGIAALIARLQERGYVRKDGKARGVTILRRVPMPDFSDRATPRALGRTAGVSHPRGNGSRFDGAAAWSVLPVAQQDAIGAIALELVAAWSLEERVFEDAPLLPPSVVRASMQGDAEIIDLLKEAFVEAIGLDAVCSPEGVPLIPTLYGRVCRHCGCSDGDACAAEGDRCGWESPDLCSACAPSCPADLVDPAAFGALPIERREG